MYYMIGLLSIVIVLESLVIIKFSRDKRFLKFKYNILLKSFESYIKNKK